MAMTQGISRDTLPFKTPFQPYVSWFAMVFFSVIIIFNGWQVFCNGNWDVQDFLIAYIGMPIYFALFLFWKVFKRTSFVKASEMDLYTGKAAVDAQVWPERHPRNTLERVWFWIA